LLTTPAVAGVVALAPLLIPLLLGNAWRGAIPLLEILALAGLLASWRTNTAYVFLATGRPGLVTVMAAARFALLLPTMVFGAVFVGLHGAAWAMLATSVLMFPVTHTLVRRVLLIRWADYGRVLWRPIFAAASMGLLVRWYLESWGSDLTNGITALACASAIGLGFVIYVALVALLWAVAGFPDSAEASARGTAMRLCFRLFGKSRRP